MAELEHWQMWRERCALARCTETAQQDLRGFAARRYARYLEKCGRHMAAPNAHDAWHTFESHLALGRQRTAKAWKEWLFARSGRHPTLDCIQGGATLIMRDVVRHQLRREQAPDWMTPLDAPIGSNKGNGHTITLTDLLPDDSDPLDAIQNRDVTTCAERILDSVYADLPRAEIIALVTHGAGRTLSHPSALQAAKCGKSTLHNALHQGLHRLANKITTAYPSETASVRMQIAKCILEHISQRSLKKLEKELPDFFQYIKEEQQHA